MLIMKYLTSMQAISLLQIERSSLHLQINPFRLKQKMCEDMSLKQNITARLQASHVASKPCSGRLEAEAVL